MAPHPRNLIRAALVEFLRTDDDGEYPTAAGIEVYDSDDSPPDPDNPRLINIYTASETLDKAYSHQDGLRRRVMDLRIECYYAGGAGGTAVDEMAWQVELAIRADPTIGNRVEWCTLTATNIFVAERGEVALWAAVMDWEIAYYTNEYAEEGVIPGAVYLGVVPDVGLGHEPDYTQII